MPAGYNALLPASYALYWVRACNCHRLTPFVVYEFGSYHYHRLTATALPACGTRGLTLLPLQFT